MIVLHLIKQNSPEWYAKRDKLYTGSNADKLLTAHDKLAIIKGESFGYAVNKGDGFSGNYYTRRGHTFEPEAIEIYEAIKGVKVRTDVGFITNTLYPGFGYSPDGWQVEVKSFKKEKHLAMTKDNIPFKILAQVHFGMAITGWKWVDLIFYNPDVDPKDAIKVFRIKRDTKIVANFKRIFKQYEIQH